MVFGPYVFGAYCIAATVTMVVAFVWWLAKKYVNGRRLLLVVAVCWIMVGATLLVDHLRMTPFFRAIRQGDRAAAAAILADHPDWLRARDGVLANRCPLSTAVVYDQQDIVKLLLEKGAEVDPEHYWASPLLWAALGNRLEIAAILIEHGANIEARGFRHDATPLHMAAWEGHLGVVDLLIGRGADIHARDANGMSALMLAAKSGYAKVVRRLLLAGADVDAAWVTGDTPLYEAAKSGHTEVVRVLLSHGADVSSAPPLWLVRDEGHTEICQLLRDAGARSSKPHQ